METSSGFHVPAWLPDWLLCLCWCCGLQSGERPHPFSSSVPLHGGSSDGYARREDAQREDETLLSKAVERSDHASHLQGTTGAAGSSSGAGTSRPIVDRATSMKAVRHKASAAERCKALEDSRFSTLAIPTFSTTTGKWSGPPGLADEDVCAICLEEYDAGNPKSFLSCGHAFHLGCILEWEERGHHICPLCDVIVASSLGD